MTVKRLFHMIPCLVLLAIVANAQQSRIDELLGAESARLVETYKSLHAAPELSGREEKTSGLVARELRALGYEVTERIGKYDQPGLVGYGVVAIMKNGAGPTVMVRADMDALPVEEKTGLPYASRVKTRNDAGLEVSVMHACGHDVHVASLLTTAKLLAQLRNEWRGTLMLVAQPAEEIIGGAKAMMADNLYGRFGKPDYLLALHAMGQAAGTVAYASGYFMASADSVDIRIRGVGGHGSRPEATKDPIVVAAQVIMALQTIISRENSPLDPAVVSVGSIHGGTKHNIIPDDVHLQLTVRTYKAEVRDRILASIERVARGTALAAGIPESLAPIVTVSKDHAPATYNDPALTARLVPVLKRAMGDRNVISEQPVMGSEDFGHFGLDGHSIPGFYFYVGVFDPEKVAESLKTGVPLPSNHSSLFAPPRPEPVLQAGVKAMVASVLELMKK